MSKGPLITRTELRKLKEQEGEANQHNQQEISREFQTAEKQIEKTYAKKHKQSKTITKSRAVETEKTKERSKTLNLAIVVVVILLLVVFYAVFNL